MVNGQEQDVDNATDDRYRWPSRWTRLIKVSLTPGFDIRRWSRPWRLALPRSRHASNAQRTTTLSSGMQSRVTEDPIGYLNANVSA